MRRKHRFTKELSVALDFGAAVSDYPEIAVPEAWSYFMRISRRLWLLFLPEYKRNRVFCKYLDGRYPEAAEMLFEAKRFRTADDNILPEGFFE
jgi:hypothetical protein